MVQRNNSVIDNMLQNRNIQQTSNNGSLAIEKRLNLNIDNAINDNHSNKKPFLGKTNDIRYMLNRHGNDSNMTNGKKLDLIKEDVIRIPDSIVKGSINKNRKGNENNSIRYIKTYDKNKSYVIEIIPNSGNPLKIKTMWKEPAGVSYDNAALPYTSKTEPNLGISTSIDNILQSSNTVNNSNMQKFNRDS